eukprot:GHVU01092250.1.p3 GENE.GHVU01092250.1~~GHVU01092250.1.p3  ORF type:complete len:100 (+),score=16.25 GHVU01092250.1:89-388(+)
MNGNPGQQQYCMRSYGYCAAHLSGPPLSHPPSPPLLLRTERRHEAIVDHEAIGVESAHEGGRREGGKEGRWEEGWWGRVDVLIDREQHDCTIIRARSQT